MSGPKLKPMEWQRRRLNSKFQFALDPFGGVYTVDGVNWTHDFASGWRSGGAEGAQADYETRIREVLVNSDDPPPTLAEAMRCPEVAALVEALHYARSYIASNFDSFWHPTPMPVTHQIDAALSALEGKP